MATLARLLTQLHTLHRQYPRVKAEVPLEDILRLEEIQALVNQMRDVMIDRDLRVGMEQKEIAYKYRLTPGRVSQIARSLRRGRTA